jgi:hypothetical protein
MRGDILFATALACMAGAGTAIARPIGGSFSSARAGTGPAGGVLLGVDGSWAASLATSSYPSEGAWSFGARAGYAFPMGLELHARYDDLGVPPFPSRAPLQLATAGLRYSIPFLFPMPFAEVDAGPAFVLSDVTFGAGAALGVSFPFANHLLVDITGHDWFVPIAGTIRQTLTIGLGLAVTFGGPQ